MIKVHKMPCQGKWLSWQGENVFAGADVVEKVIEYQSAGEVRVESFGGHYVLNGEKTLILEQGELLFLTGYGFVDNSCCGVGGCSYALVLGWVIEKKNRGGKTVFTVRLICDPAEQLVLSNRIKQREHIGQVIFKND